MDFSRIVREFSMSVQTMKKGEEDESNKTIIGDE